MEQIRGFKINIFVRSHGRPVVKAEDSQPRSRGIESLLALYTEWNVSQRMNIYK